jgi:CheY-like chemotaxis protein
VLNTRRRQPSTPRGPATGEPNAIRRQHAFLAMLAHELRNPLAAISSAVAIASNPHLEGDHHWSLGVIGRHVRHLEQLVDSLLDASRSALDVAPATDAPERNVQGPAIQTGVSVLLVDDNLDATRALALLLTHAGFTVVQAHDGVEALQRASQHMPDVVLLDLCLPMIDGYQVAAALRARVDGVVPLLVALSGHGQPEDRRRTLAAGFDHHLVKPVDCGQLLALMRSR